MMTSNTGLYRVIWLNSYYCGCRDGSVATSTCYGLEGPGTEFRWSRDFPHPYRPALRTTQPPIQCVKGLFHGIKRPGRDIDHPTASSAEVKERVVLYLYSPSGPSWSIIGWHFYCCT